jgi:hypothetical protein
VFDVARDAATAAADALTAIVRPALTTGDAIDTIDDLIGTLGFGRGIFVSLRR